MGKLDYGVVGNCRTAALISNKGSIEWFCFPDFDSPSIFSKILDKDKGGSFELIPEKDCIISQKYLEHTNILCTTYEMQEGAFEVLDFMPRYKIGELNSYYLPPELYRFIRLKRGKPQLTIRYNPRPDYGKETVFHKSGPSYIKTISTKNNRNTIYLYSDLSLQDIMEEKCFVLTGDAYLMISYNQKLIKIDLTRVYLEYQRTKVYWLDWINRSKKFTLYNNTIERSMLVLKLLSYQRSGAVLAALTTSIPETIGGTRNWDYRFCWLRDASMSIKTLISLGHKGAARRFMGFIHNVLKSKQENFQIMYGIRNEKILTEKTLPHLSGFEGSKPVRIGNMAYLQKQNDSLGYLMDVIYYYYMYFPGTLDEIEEMWEVVKNIVKSVSEEWEKPDNGIWEIRNSVSHFVLSKVMCWVAMDRAVKIALLLGESGYVLKWEAVAAKIKQDVLDKGWKEEISSFSQTYDNTELDASLLLMEDYGFISSSDEKYIKTVDAILKELMNNGLLYRYRNQDGFGKPVTAFTICNFWLVKALFRIGRINQAKEIFERLLTYGNHLNLFSEDLDFETKEQLGNFPQAYSHLAIIETAILFSEEQSFSRFIRP
ncbi:MAG: glycoside hydrolase family 15 protein [Bacteroidales bacterium]|nr:glycoside hydrolase family 15 protein [Bacteroidales bacterium]MDD2425766.1 glycoside hydrolase family 15 protein [Bacteroidales bacterium]MDD3988948.1 glycoside hydrolase family 15 protein [Bacteroidales bacterium]MDD4638498.1 glycoside hydrolase family 15 protein [Bacteroidales bacterium]